MAKEINYQFVIMPMFVMKDKELSNNDRVAYGIIRSYMWGQKNLCNPSQEKIMADFPGFPARTFKRSIGKLKELGYFQIQKGGDGESNTYYLVDQSGQFGLTEIQRGQNEHFSEATVAPKTYNESNNKIKDISSSKSQPFQTYITTFFKRLNPDIKPPSYAFVNSSDLFKRYSAVALKEPKFFDTMMDFYFNPPAKIEGRPCWWANGARSWSHFYKSFDSIASWVLEA